ncbi:hypothetical protein V8C37DRAFT_409106 [Trichoderma ceciliae]
MDKGKGRENSQTPRRGITKKQVQHQNRQHEVPKQQWGAVAKMASAKAQVNDKRLVTSVADEGDYLGEPPTDRDLIEVRNANFFSFFVYTYHPNLVTMTRKLLTLHEARIPNIFKVSSESISQLQKAIDAINQRFHDLRLSQKLLTWVYIIQKSSRVAEDARVRLEIGSRPSLVGPPTGLDDVSRTTAALFQEIGPLLQASTECLTSVSSDIRMRVTFGRLYVQQRKRSLGYEITYDEFADLAKLYSRRRGLRLDTWLMDIRVANSVIKHMMAFDGDGDLRLDHKSKRRTHSLILRIEGQELWVEDWTNDKSTLSRAKIGTSFPSRWLNWIVAAPDTTFDWSLKAVSHEFSSVPTSLQDLIKGIERIPSKREDTDHFLRTSEVRVHNPKEWGDKVSETRLKTSFIAEFQDTPYMLEINIEQVWKGLKTKSKPETRWGIELYGKHWDSAMNQVNPIDRRKDWGEGLKNVWVGTDPDLGKRFSNFLQVVVQLQKQLDIGIPSSEPR